MRYLSVIFSLYMMMSTNTTYSIKTLRSKTGKIEKCLDSFDCSLYSRYIYHGVKCFEWIMIFRKFLRYFLLIEAEKN